LIFSSIVDEAFAAGIPILIILLKKISTKKSELTAEAIPIAAAT